MEKRTCLRQMLGMHQQGLMFFKQTPIWSCQVYWEVWEKARFSLWLLYCLDLKALLRHGNERWPLVLVTLVVRYPFTQRIMYAKLKCRQGRCLTNSRSWFNSLSNQLPQSKGAPTASQLGRVQHPQQPGLRRWIDVGGGTKCCWCCPAWCGHASGYSCHRMCQCSHSPSMSWSGVTGRFFWLNDGACSGAYRFSTFLNDSDGRFLDVESCWVTCLSVLFWRISLQQYYHKSCSNSPYLPIEVELDVSRVWGPTYVSST